MKKVMIIVIYKEQTAFFNCLCKGPINTKVKNIPIAATIKKLMYPQLSITIPPNNGPKARPIDEVDKVSP